jgi:uncharacterized protein
LTLQQTESGACAFLGSDGCTVYPDRPLVCRLYPLGRSVGIDGTESFCHIEPHPQSTGKYTRSGTIAKFLAAQDAHPFMRAMDDYYTWLRAALEYLNEATDGEGASIAADHQNGALELLDMDAAIARHCTEAKVAEPKDIEARRQLHLAILYQQLEADRRERAISEHDKAAQATTTVLLAAVYLLGASLGLWPAPAVLDSRALPQT